MPATILHGKSFLALAAIAYATAVLTLFMFWYEMALTLFYWWEMEGNPRPDDIRLMTPFLIMAVNLIIFSGLIASDYTKRPDLNLFIMIVFCLFGLVYLELAAIHLHYTSSPLWRDIITYTAAFSGLAVYACRFIGLFVVSGDSGTEKTTS